jgi:hypothetical protein
LVINLRPPGLYTYFEDTNGFKTVDFKIWKLKEPFKAVIKRMWFSWWVAGSPILLPTRSINGFPKSTPLSIRWCAVVRVPVVDVAD